MAGWLAYKVWSRECFYNLYNIWFIKFSTAYLMSVLNYKLHSVSTDSVLLITKSSVLKSPGTYQGLSKYWNSENHLR